MIICVFLILCCYPMTDDDQAPSCGATALYYLSSACGKNIPLETWHEQLPNRTEGHSLGELIEVAQVLGLHLQAVEIKAGDRLPAYPCILYISPSNEKNIGHFVFLNPLDRRGSQYQLLEPPMRPMVLSASEILENPRFGARLLVPRPWLSMRQYAGITFLLLGVAVFGYGCWRHFRKTAGTV